MESLIDISFGAISEALHGFNFPEIDLVLGISAGGYAPALMIAHQLGVSLKLLEIQQESEASIIEKSHEWDFFSHPRILIVEDISTTGNHLKFLKDTIEAYEVHTFSIFGIADYVLFPKVKSHVTLPWTKI
jgi:hypothetical protein